jgi:hypothetical protein
MKGYPRNSVTKRHVSRERASSAPRPAPDFAGWAFYLRDGIWRCSRRLLALAVIRSAEIGRDRSNLSAPAIEAVAQCSKMLVFAGVSRVCFGRFKILG